MATDKKPKFPQTPDGVTDWERVFESPQDGLIPLISNANSVAGLRECTLLVVRKLFTRADDQLEVARLTRQLDGLIAKQGGTPNVKDLSAQIAGLLRQIKDSRIQIARAYVAGKRKKRRSATVGERMAKTSYALINSPRFNFVMSAVAAVLFLTISGTAITVFWDGNPIRSGSENPAAPSDAAAPAATPESDEAVPTPPAVAAPEVDLVEMPPAVVLQRLFLPNPAGKEKSRSEMVLPILVLAKTSDLSRVCKLLPVTLDALNIQLGKFLGRKSGLSRQDLEGVGRQVRTQLNNRAAREMVSRIILVRGADFRDQGGLRCELAGEKFLKYLNEN